MKIHYNSYLSSLVPILRYFRYGYDFNIRFSFRNYYIRIWTELNLGRYPTSLTMAKLKTMLKRKNLKGGLLEKLSGHKQSVRCSFNHEASFVGE